MKIQSNHSFCVDWALNQPRHARVLDYGCGAGEIVTALRARGVDASGCDVYYEGGDLSSQAAKELFDREVLRRMTAQTIPFEDESFDLIINNTVLEHVEDLDLTLTEIHRVLKPGGKVLSLLPHREVWFEWHIGLPFIHWFKPRSRARLGYAALLRALGFGFFKSGKPVFVWARDAMDWIDNWTHYRSRPEIDSAFRAKFSEAGRLEARWLEHKFGDAAIVLHMPTRLKLWATTLLAGLVFECEKLAPGTAQSTAFGQTIQQ